MDFSVLNNSKIANPNAAASTTSSTDDASATADRFLKLLVAQMQNQDPLNPMDNAQVTTQMAQINTVQGISTLNTTVSGLSSQLVQMQALQGASLVGHDVVVPGNQMDIADGVGVGGFKLDSPADAVKVEVLNAGGHVVDTLNLGAQGTGQHSFRWDASKATDTNLTFRVTATSGASAVTASPLMRDTVSAINTSGSTLSLELLKSGTVPYSQVTALN
jgi:flagellar basal-body rod modification protein FlgD